IRVRKANVSLRQADLPCVKHSVACSGQQNRQAVAKRIGREVCLRDGRMLLGPRRGGKGLDVFCQRRVDLSESASELRSRKRIGNSPIRLQELFIQIRAQPRPEAEYCEHLVMNCGEMPNDVIYTIPTGRNLCL